MPLINWPSDAVQPDSGTLTGFVLPNESEITYDLGEYIDPYSLTPFIQSSSGPNDDPGYPIANLFTLNTIVHNYI